MDSFLTEKLFNNQFIVIWFGALVGQIFSLNRKGYKGTIPFFSRLFPIKNKRIYELIDFFLSPFLGAIFVFLSLSPDTTSVSLYTGLTWTTTLLLIAEFRREEVK